MAASAITTAASATWAIFARFGFVNSKGAPTHLGSIESVDCRLCVGIRLHLNKPESFGLTGISVSYYRSLFYITYRSEQVFQIFLGSGIRQPADIDTLRHSYQTPFRSTSARTMGLAIPISRTYRTGVFPGKQEGWHRIPALTLTETKARSCYP